MNETKDDINKWKDILCSWFIIIKIVKIYIQPKAIYKFNSMLIKMAFSTEVEQMILKFVWKYSRPLMTKNNLQKEHNCRWHMFLFQNILQSYCNQKSMVLAKKKKKKVIKISGTK